MCNILHADACHYLSLASIAGPDTVHIHFSRQRETCEREVQWDRFDPGGKSERGIDSWLQGGGPLMK